MCSCTLAIGSNEEPVKLASQMKPWWNQDGCVWKLVVSGCRPSNFGAPYFQPNLYEATTFGGRRSLLRSRGRWRCTVKSWLFVWRCSQGMAACRGSHGARGLHTEFWQRQLGEFRTPSTYQPASIWSVIFQVLCGNHLTTLKTRDFITCLVFKLQRPILDDKNIFALWTAEVLITFAFTQAGGCHMCSVWPGVSLGMAGGRAVIEGVQKNLKLTDRQIRP